ncbi:MAG: hypothetical protein PUC94_07360 [Bacteroidales bacterium]|nr:hypothetical protein [Bacteroidales bacterium]
MTGPLVPVLILGGALAVTGTLLYLHHRLWYKGRDEEEAAETSAGAAAAPAAGHGYRSSSTDNGSKPANGTGTAPASAPATAAPGNGSGAEARPEGCCGLHEVCEKAADAIAENDLYYDDEELDEFRGRDADSYTEAEVDLFREVLLTLRRDELLAWEAALRERHLALPSQLRDELILLLEIKN